MKQRFAPLTTGFTLASLIGVVLSAIYVMKWDSSLGFAFVIVFLCMLLASLRSMRWANPDAQLKMK